MAQSVQVKKVSWWHEALVDWELSNPDSTLQECARFFNRSQSWISVIRNSDTFKAYREERRLEHETYLSASVVAKAEGLAHVTLEELARRVEDEREKIAFGPLRETAELALRTLGYGGNGTKVNVNLDNRKVNIGVDPRLLQEARDEMRRSALEDKSNTGSDAKVIQLNDGQEVPTSE